MTDLVTGRQTDGRDRDINNTGTRITDTLHRWGEKIHKISTTNDSSD